LLSATGTISTATIRPMKKKNEIGSAWRSRFGFAGWAQSPSVRAGCAESVRVGAVEPPHV
jgi:hypothetical protein